MVRMLAISSLLADVKQANTFDTSTILLLDIDARVAQLNSRPRRPQGQSDSLNHEMVKEDNAFPEGTLFVGVVLPISLIAKLSEIRPGFC